MAPPNASSGQLKKAVKFTDIRQINAPQPTKCCDKNTTACAIGPCCDKTSSSDVCCDQDTAVTQGNCPQKPADCCPPNAKTQDYCPPKACKPEDCCPPKACKPEDCCPPKACKLEDCYQPKACKPRDYCPPKPCNPGDYGPPKACKPGDYCPPKACKPEECCPPKACKPGNFCPPKACKPNDPLNARPGDWWQMPSKNCLKQVNNCWPNKDAYGPSLACRLMSCATPCRPQRLDVIDNSVSRYPAPPVADQKLTGRLVPLPAISTSTPQVSVTSHRKADIFYTAYPISNSTQCLCDW